MANLILRSYFLSGNVSKTYRRMAIMCRCQLRTLSSGVKAQDNANPEESPEEALCKLLNTATAKEIEGFRCLSEKKSLNIIKHRQSVGSFRSIAELNLVKTLGERTVTKMLKEFQDNEYSIPTRIDVKKPASGLNITLKESLHPPYHDSKVPSSVVSLCLQPDGLSWARMNRDWQLTDWNYVEFGDFMLRKHDHVVQLFNIWHTLEEIPEGDIYIVNEGINSMSPKSMNWPSINVIRLDSTLTLYLCMWHKHTVYNPYQETPELKPVVFKMKRTSFGRYFNTIVGQEVVSGQHVCKEIMESSRKNCHVRIDDEMRNNFSTSVDLTREQLSLALLQVTMFFELLHDGKHPVSHVLGNLHDTLSSADNDS